MIIVHVITSFGIGGAEKLLLNVVNKQVENHKVYLVYFKKNNDLIPFVDKRVIIKNIPLSFSTKSKLKSFFNEINPHIIHTHLGHADILGFLAAKKTKAKIFTTIHSTFFKKNFLDHIYFFLYRQLLKKITRIQIIAISKSVENLALKKFKVSKERIHLLYNAIPETNFNFNKNTKQYINLLFVGRLSKAKSIETLLKSLIFLKDYNFKLTIVGDGEMKEQLKLLSNKLKLGNKVNFVGKHNSTNIFYKEADIFILPSIWEGFGLVILEAFRSKTAVIASNIEGPAELVTSNENGLLFEPKNEKDLAIQIEKLINNPSLRNSLAENGYKTFSKKYHINTYLNKLQKVYDSTKNH